jgi:GAF domain-containing protein
MTNVKQTTQPPLISEILNSAAFSNRWFENFLKIVMRSAVAFGAVLFIYVILYDDFITRVALGIILFILVVVTFAPVSYSIRGIVLAASIYLIALVILLGWGVSADATMFLLGFIAITTLLFDHRFGLVALALSIITMTIIGWLVLSSFYKLLVVFGTSGLASDWIIYSLDMTAMGGIIILAVYFLKREFNAVLGHIRETFKALQTEQARVDESTARLLKANQENAAQATMEASRLRTIAEVARTAVAVVEPDRLMNLLTNLISQQLGFYHIGIFLLDEPREYAILSAANSDGGRRMLTRRHRLQVGQQGIVGNVTSSGKPRIALDVGTDAVFFNNPDLPETHSEMCLPLKVNEVVIGALDIQSTQAKAFTEEDYSILSILADQVAIAIQNAKSNEETKRALQEAEVASSQLTGRIWKEYKSEHDVKGYSFRGTKAEPIEGNSPNNMEANGEIHVPIRLHGQIIGNLKLNRANEERPWSDDELALTQATADRVALALENARLLEDSQRRASKERVIGEVTTKISQSINLRNVLQTAVEELGRVIPGSDVVIQLQSSNDGQRESTL